MFLRGPAGVALVLLRLAVTVALIGDIGAARAFAPGLLVAFTVAASVLVCAGLLTSLGAAAAVVHAIGHAVAGDVPAAFAAVAALQSAALAVIGPGAYSLDARLFGRRQVFRAQDGGETRP